MAGVGYESRNATRELRGIAQRASPESLALSYLVCNRISNLTADFTGTKCGENYLTMIQDAAF